MHWGERTKQLRIERGLKQQDLAEKLHIRQSSISSHELVEYPSLKYIEKVCKFLKIPLYQFFATDAEKLEINPLKKHYAEMILRIEQLPPEAQKKILKHVSDALGFYEEK